MDEKQILVSLGDDKVKEIGEVIGNKTCNKILDLLVESEMTPTEISKKLKIPLNTTDYNIKKLVKSGLIESASKWWSVKGKKISSYKISNKQIIISPKKPLNKVFLWTIGLTGALTLMIGKISKKVAVEAPMMPQTNLATKAYDSGAVESLATDIAPRTISVPLWQTLQPWSWFLLGAWAAILTFSVFSIISERRKRNEKNR